MATTASVGLASDFRSAPRRSRDTPEARPRPAGKRAAPAHQAADGDPVWPEDSCPPASLEPAPQVKARLLTGTSGHAHHLCTWAQGSHAKVGNLFSLLKAFRIVLKNLAGFKCVKKH